MYFNFFAKYNLYTEQGKDAQILADYEKLGRDNFEGLEEEDTAPEQAPVIPKCLNNTGE